jgi:ribosome-associated protein
VRGKSPLTDFFVVATGAAAPHLKALVAETQAAMKDAGVQSYRTSGDPESGWIVVDYFDVVVHVFSPEARAYYALEKLWA